MASKRQFGSLGEFASPQARRTTRRMTHGPPVRPPVPDGTPEARTLRDGEELVAHRLVKTLDRMDPGLIESFKSNAELGKPPRGREEREPEVHRGVSMFKAHAQAVERRQRILNRLIREGRADQLGIGDYVAMLRLVGPDFCFEDRGGTPDGHMTIWGSASSLVTAVVEITQATPPT